MSEQQSPIEHARNSLERIQQFEVDRLPREQDLGTGLSFRAALEPAQRIVDLYKRLTITALDDFPDPVLNTIKQRADADFALFQQILDFSPEQANPHQAREGILNNLKNAYPQGFQILHPYISYSLHRAADFQRLDSEARGIVQGIKDETEALRLEMAEHRDRSKNILAEVQATAAEQGVTQQATYFKGAASSHGTTSDRWKTLTYIFASVLGLYAVLSFFIHKIPFLSPDTTYEAVQLTVSKVLVFGVISFLLYLSARNFMAHQHNRIVNEHRQNALLTYRALVEAAATKEATDTVLTHASSCIFGPQPTAYTAGASGESPTARSIVELVGSQLTSNN